MNWSSIITMAIVAAIGLGMPFVIFILRENIKEIRQGIITDLARFFESGTGARPDAGNGASPPESYKIIPSFEFVKYKYFLSRPKLDPGDDTSADDQQRDLAPWKFFLSMVPFAVVVIGFSCLTLSFFLFGTTPGDVIENVFGGVTKETAKILRPGVENANRPPHWLRADDLA